MGKNNSDADSGSDSHSSGSKSPSRSRSGTPKGSPGSRNSGDSDRSRSGTPQSRNSRSRSPRSHRSSSAHSGHSGSAGSQHSAASKRSRTPRSRTSNSSPVAKKTPPPSVAEQNSDDSRSQSPNLQIDDRANSRSRSRSASGSESNHSRSGTRSKSGSPAEGRKSRSRSRSSSGGSRKSRSGSRSSRSKTRSRSGSANSRKSGSSHTASESGGDKEKKIKRKAVLSGSEAEDDDISPKKNIEATVPKAKKSRIIDSDSEVEEESAKQIDAQDIFGDADDISVSDDEEDKKSDVASEHGSQQNRRSRSSSRQSDRSRQSERSRTPRSRSVSQERAEIMQPPKEDEVEPIPETRIDVEIPRIVTDLGKEIHFVKLPNFLSVDTRPFDTETYEDEIDEEETMDEEGRQRIKLKVSNTIRWREYMNNDGEMVKESNARFVRWSDGSLTLHLGNETFDVYRQPLHGDHNHMFIRQGTGLQGQAVFRTKLTFRPHSTESFTHKKMTMSLADRSQKTSGIKILTQVGKDPTTDRLYNLKKEEEKLRQAMRAQHKPQPKKKKAGSHASHGDGAHSYLNDEGSDDENVISLSAIKNKYKKGGAATLSDQKASAIYSSDDDEGSDFEGRRKKVDKTKSVKALRDSDSDDSDGGSRKQVDDSHTENEAEDEDDVASKSGSVSGEHLSGTEN